MKKRGFTLTELLTVFFLMGILGHLLFVLIFPVFRAYARNFACAGLAQNLNIFLDEMAADIQSAALPGFNFHSRGSDWTVALVAREWPLIDRSAAWSKQVIVYHYDSENHRVSRSLLDSPLKNDGTPKLNGSEPVKLDANSLVSAALARPQKSIPAVFSDSWTDPTRPLHLKISGVGSETVDATRIFSWLLVTP